MFYIHHKKDAPVVGRPFHCPMCDKEATTMVYEMMTEAEREQFPHFASMLPPPLPQTSAEILNELIAMRKYNEKNPPTTIPLREKYTKGTPIPFSTAPKQKQ